MSSSSIVQAARVKLPLGPIYKPKELVTTSLQQVATVQDCGDYPNQPAVQNAAGVLFTAATALGTTVTKLVNHEVEGRTLITQRDQQVIALQLAHGTLRSSLNDASKGNKVAAKAWTGQIEGRNAVPESTAAPVNATVKTLRAAGSVEIHCQAERGVICYLIQQGSDPANPDAWPAPAISSGCTHKVAGLTIGQKAYFRMAIVRRNGGQGAWSGVMAITVR